ncbi:MAG TPA: hypothetical protein VFS27_12970, partial [Blastocatellia bacterium]|nr:hypothetical protein [Blastocatellia bacterium]
MSRCCRGAGKIRQSSARDVARILVAHSVKITMNPISTTRRSPRLPTPSATGLMLLPKLRYALLPMKTRRKTASAANWKYLHGVQIKR